MRGKRTYYKTIIQVEVLSNDPYDVGNLEDLHYDITEGDYSGDFKIISQEKLTKEEMAKALEAQGSDPEFMMPEEEEENENE